MIYADDTGYGKMNNTGCPIYAVYFGMIFTGCTGYAGSTDTGDSAGLVSGFIW